MGDRPGPEHGDRRHVHGRTDRLEPSRLGSGHGDSRQVPKHTTSTCDIFGVVEKGHADGWFLPSAARDADIIPEATELHINLVPMATVARGDLGLQSYPKEATELHIDLIEVIQGCRRILPHCIPR